jgi:hypothetical protein
VAQCFWKSGSILLEIDTETEDDKRLIFARYQIDRGYLTEQLFEPSQLDRAA